MDLQNRTEAFFLIEQARQVLRTIDRADHPSLPIPVALPASNMPNAVVIRKAARYLLDSADLLDGTTDAPPMPEGILVRLARLLQAREA